MRTCVHECAGLCVLVCERIRKRALTRMNVCVCVHSNECVCKQGCVSACLCVGEHHVKLCATCMNVQACAFMCALPHVLAHLHASVFTCEPTCAFMQACKFVCVFACVRACCFVVSWNENHSIIPCERVGIIPRELVNTRHHEFPRIHPVLAI